MGEHLQKIKEAAELIRRKSPLVPRIGIILGTGLSPLADQVEKELVLPYPEIPHFPCCTVEEHQGNLVLGKLAGNPVAVLQGRFHLYEGYSPRQIAFPVQVMRMLGAQILLESNAAGGLNPLFKAGDLVMITDHINLQGVNPLAGENEDELGPRFPDMSEVYDLSLLEKARQTALEERIPVREGVYASVLGPNLETRAEYRFLRLIGADLVGMSTVPEVIAAVHCGLRVFGVAVVTDLCLPDALKPTSLDAILAVAKRVEPRLTRLFSKLVAGL